MSKDLAVRYDVPVPRYTSYPTAPHFGGAVQGDVYRRWLSELDRREPVSLYFHIPFCQAMCWFCGCYTKIVNRYEPIAAYLDSLLGEVDLVADALPGRFRASHLHWGGGSPTMLSGADWRRTFEKLRARFDISRDAEIAVELDPRTATEDYVRTLAEAGVNRASIGVQDFHPEVQHAINRVQPFEVTERVVGWLKRHGIADINMDLLYGLPHQTTRRVVDMVDKALSLGPARVALFGYAHVPWMKTHQRLIDEAALPGSAERWAQLRAAAGRLIERGYVAVGLDHFALPSDSLARALGGHRLHRNFQGYTADTARTLLGFGASAIGSLPQGYVQNLLPLKTYRERIGSGALATTRGIALNADDRLRGEIIGRLMCDLAVDVADVCHRHGVAPAGLASEMAAIEPLVRDGLVTRDDGRLRITEDGRPFVRVVAAAFDAYLGRGQGRHSRAV